MRDHQLGWTLPAQPLGEAIKPEKPVKVCEFREFDSKPHEVIAWPEIPKKTGATFHERKAERAAPPQSKWTPKVGEKVKVISCDHSQPMTMLGCVGVVAEFDDFGFFCLSFQEPENKLYPQWFNPTEVEPISTSSDSDGWVAWEAGPGKKCPVPDLAAVEIRWPSGREGVYPAYCVAGWDNAIGGPVAYRILP